MTRLPWRVKGSNLDLSSAGFPDCSVLVPETDADRTELLGVLDAEGVSDRVRFTKSGIDGRLNFSASPQWLNDGVLQLSVSTADGQISPMWLGVTQLVHDRIASGWFGRFSRH